jgi:hypothetical protein
LGVIACYDPKLPFQRYHAAETRQVDTKTPRTFSHAAATNKKALRMRQGRYFPIMENYISRIAGVNILSFFLP